jgi:antitoxin ParD1/3/4
MALLPKCEPGTATQSASWRSVGNLCYLYIVPTRNVNLTDELDRFVLTKVKSGRYENASEVVRAALRTLERDEQECEAKLIALRAAIDEGNASGIAAAKKATTSSKPTGCFPSSRKK